MFAQFEEKGKIYTQVVSKIPVEVVVQTTHQIIRGRIHIRPDSRLKDELNTSDPFIAITEVEITNLEGEILHKGEFLAVNRAQIVWVLPLHNDLPEEKSE